MHTYTKEQRMPTLQELADALCEDKEMEYVVLESKAVASIDKVIVGDKKSIFTKIKKYPYEFEINSSLQLASIDGVKIATNETVTIDKAEYEQLKNSIEDLKSKVEEYEQSKTTIENLTNKVEQLENISIQKARSDQYEDVAFTNGSTFIAPCDGYYCYACTNSSSTQKYACYVTHYSTSDIQISKTGNPSYLWRNGRSRNIYEKRRKNSFSQRKWCNSRA